MNEAFGTREALTISAPNLGLVKCEALHLVIASLVGIVAMVFAAALLLVMSDYRQRKIHGAYDHRVDSPATPRRRVSTVRSLQCAAGKTGRQ